MKHLVVIAGEESGDFHAASFIKELKAKHPTLKVTGIGGRHMQAAGADLISDLAQFGVTGLTEVIRHFFVIKKAYRAIQEHLRETTPDLLVLVDYPGFNLRLAKFAKKTLNLRIVYYISPQIWAWKANRLQVIRACVDRMAVIFPFEKVLYEKGQIPVNFVGHPLTENRKEQQEAPTRMKLGLPADKRIIALLPGSRLHEIERHMPVLCAMAEKLSQQFKDIHFVIPVAGTLPISIINQHIETLLLPITVLKEQAIESVSLSDMAIVASGTASLECALLEKPMCIIYKTSQLTYLLATQLIKIKYLGLCNILAGSMIVPEFLQDDCNAQALTEWVSAQLKDATRSKNMVKQLGKIKNSLSSESADCSIYELINREIFS